MRLSKNTSIQYFPFAPEIPWHIKNGRYIIPKLDVNSWNKAVLDRNIVVVGFGGLFESFFSLSILEALNIRVPKKKLFWCGDPRFNYLVQANGLASLYYGPINEDTIAEYTTPLFFDNNNNAYVNFLNNYICVHTYYGKYGYQSGAAVTKQLFDNSLFNWDLNYIPKFRLLQSSPEFDQWCKREKLYINKPYMLIFPDRTGWSDHTNTCLNWNPTQIKALAAMLKQIGVSLVICTTYPGHYYGSKLHLLPVQLEYIFNLLPTAKAIMATEIDLLLVASMISSGKILTIKQKKEFDLIKNMKFLSKEINASFFTNEELQPAKVFEQVKDLV
jgi:hypothetical protein